MRAGGEFQRRRATSEACDCGIRSYCCSSCTSRKSDSASRISFTRVNMPSSAVIFPLPVRRCVIVRLFSTMIPHSPSFGFAGLSSVLPPTPRKYLSAPDFTNRYQPQSSCPGEPASAPFAISLSLGHEARSSPKQHGLMKCAPIFERLKRLVLKRMRRTFKVCL